MPNIEREVIQLIKVKMKEKDLNIPALARRMGVHQSTVSKILISNQVKIGRLRKISEILEYNFLRVLADKIEINNPPRFIADPAKLAEDVAIRQRVSKLEIENEVLMKVLGK